MATSASAAPANIPTVGTLYGTDAGGGNLYTINPITGAGTNLGSLGIGQTSALAGDATTIYAGTSGSANNLYTVNPVGPSSTLIGNGGLGGAGYAGLDFDSSGVLYASANIAGTPQTSGTGSDHLVTINTTTGVATVVGPYGTCSGVSIPTPAQPAANGSCTIEGMDAIAFDSSGQLWGVENVRGAAGTPGLYKINKTTGAATFQLAITSGPIDGLTSLQFACDGTLYGGSARQTDGGRLGKLNTTTGAWTFISPAPFTTGGPQFNSLGGLAAVPSTCTFNVNKDFQPNDPGSVTVAVTCTDGGVATATDSSASESDDANFVVSGFTLGSDPTCTATESSVPAGYTINQCSALLSAGSCTIVNPETSTTFTVNKVYSPSGPLTPVAVTVGCTSGTVTPSSGMAAPGSPFVATVTHFNLSGTTCTASETVPSGYAASSDCATVPISDGAPASCTITNTFITPTPTPGPAVGGIVELPTAGSSGGGFSAGLLIMLAAALFVAMGGTFAYARARR